MVKDNESGNIYYADNDLTSLVRTDSVTIKDFSINIKQNKPKEQVEFKAMFFM